MRRLTLFAFLLVAIVVMSAGAVARMRTQAALTDSATGSASVAAARYWVGNLSIQKVYSDSNTSAVSVGIVCTNGAAASTSPASPAPGTPANVSIDDIPVAGTTCTLTEASLPEYTSAWSGDCVPDVSSNGVVSLTGGQSKTCTVTNTRKTGALKVIKTVSGSSVAPSAFTMHVTEAGTDVSGSPQAGSAAGNDYTLPTGAYVVSETGPGGYNASFGGACDGSGNITVLAGQNVTCTVTNTAKTATFTVNKVYSPSGSTPVQITLSCGSGEITSTNPQPASPGNPAVFTVRAIATATTTCTATEAVPSGYTSNHATTCANITLAAEGSASCTITNTQELTTNTLYFDSEAGSGCGATHSIEKSSSSVSGSVNIVHETEVVWVGHSTDGLTILPSGTYSVTLARSSGTAATGVTVTIGVCSGGTFTPVGTTTTDGSLWNSSPETHTVNVSVASSTTLSPTTLVAIKIYDTGNNSNKDFNLATDGSSYLTAPGDLQP